MRRENEIKKSRPGFFATVMKKDQLILQGDEVDLGAAEEAQGQDCGADAV